MRRDRLFLQDILEAADAIQQFVAGHSLQTFTTSDLHRSAAVQKLTTIGEAAGRLPDELRRRYSTIP
jgi:uncharacterized protein with HEPN domain